MGHGVAYIPETSGKFLRSLLTSFVVTNHVGVSMRSAKKRFNDNKVKYKSIDGLFKAVPKRENASAPGANNALGRSFFARFTRGDSPHRVHSFKYMQPLKCLNEVM